MSTVKQVLAIAAGELGQRENPPGSNRSKYGAWYGMDGQPWCAMFISWVLAQAGMPLNISTPKGFAYCPYGVDWFKRQGGWHTSSPQPGDVVFFDWHPGAARSGAYHVGFVESVNTDGSLTCIEGNTSLTSNDNGGLVMRRVRPRRLVLGFGRPRYAPEPALKLPPTIREVTAVFSNGERRPALLVDGDSYILARDLSQAGLNAIWEGAGPGTVLISPVQK